MIVALLAMAFAAAPLDVGEVMAQGPLAIDLIEECREDRCDVTDAELAEAFAVRAAYTAIEDGTIDQAAADNIAVLDPVTGMVWSDLLPEVAGEPEDWVRRRVNGEPPPKERRKKPKADRVMMSGADRASFALGGGSVVAGPTEPAAFATGSVWGGIGNGFSLRFRGDLRQGRPRTDQMFDPAVVQKSSGWAARLQLGHSWQAEGGAQLGASLGFALGRAAYTTDSALLLDHLGFRARTTWNAAYGVGLFGRAPLDQRGAAAATFDVWIAQLSVIDRPSSLQPRSVYPLGSLRSPDVDLGLRLKPGSSGWSVWAGLRYQLANERAHPQYASVASGLGVLSQIGWSG